MEDVLAISGLLFLLCLAGAGFALGSAVGLVKGEGAGALLRGAEAAVLAFVGGFLARAFISLLLSGAHNGSGVGLVVGWTFFLWPGAIDTIAGLLGERLLTTPQQLVWLASAVGALTGMMDGIWRIHDWKGLGWLSFPLDVTWGLAGTTNGCLLHLINFAWGDHGTESREGAHRYARGFGLKPGFAFTQGSVMSNLRDGPSTDLFRHERTHVWQNRMFGPLFILTYVGWMVVWFVPGIIAGAVVRAGVFQGVEKWCYFNCPWEAWGYAVQHQDRRAFGFTDGERRLIWPTVFVILWAIPFFALALLVGGLVVSKTWFS